MSDKLPLEFVKTGFGLASQFMNACTSSWGKLVDASQPRRSSGASCRCRTKGTEPNDPGSFWPLALSLLPGNT